MQVQNMKFGICRCFLLKNIYIFQLEVHIDYLSDDQVIEDLEDLMKIKKISSEEILTQIHKEIDRRKTEIANTQQMAEYVDTNYRFLHPSLIQQFNEKEWFHPDFISLLNSKDPKSIIEKYAIPNLLSSYQFPIFTPSFVDLLNEEFDHFNKQNILHNQPNTMNRKGVLISELKSFDQTFIKMLREKYLNSLCNAIYPQWTGNSGLDSHRAFTVEYATGLDESLNKHYDNAEVTLNVSLLNAFECGGELLFSQMRPNNVRGEIDGADRLNPVKVISVPGWAVLHRSQYQHSLKKIVNGRRRNLIIWMRSSSLRELQCPRCDGKPDVIPVDYGYGDGFIVPS